MKYILPIILSFIPICSFAQYLEGVGTKWSDEFTEWNIYSVDENNEPLVGELRMRWQLELDWTEWDFRLGEMTGSIQRVFKTDPTQWDVNVDGELVTIRTKWSNDFSEWRITDNSRTINFQSLYRNDLNQWETKSDTYGNFVIYTEWENDPREWIILDEMDEEISFAMKLAMLFIAIYNSSPKQ